MKHVLAYAYLIANFDSGAKTPLEVLNGVVARALAMIGGQATAHAVSEKIQADWGLTIPIKVIRYAISSLIGQGKVDRELDERAQEERFSSISSEDLKTSFRRQESEARAKYDRFRKKINHILFQEQLNRKFTPDEVIEGWLDKSALAFLGTGEILKQPRAEDFEINRVVVKAIGLDSRIDNEALTDLTDLAVGDVLYRSLKEVTEYEAEADSDVNPTDYRAQRNLDAYLDIGVISRAFGYYGAEHELAIKQMFEMSRDVGFHIKAFRHTIEELQEVISAAASQMQSGGSNFRGPMLHFALRTGKTAFDIIREARAIDQKCADLGIEIVDRPDPDTALTVDELELEHQIKMYVQQENPRARHRDVDSLTSIFRLRRGEPKATIDTASAIFITHNRSLQAASHKFFREHFQNSHETNVVQLCMTDVVFSSRLWVKLPTAVNWKPRSQVIACALSNLAPAPGVRESFLQRLRELVLSGKLDEQAATLVEFSRFTYEILALDYNYGDRFDDNAVDSVVNKVVQRMKSGLIAARSEGRTEGILEESKSIEKFETEFAGRLKNKTEEINELKGRVIEANRDVQISKRVSQSLTQVISSLVFSLLLSGTVLAILMSAGAVTATVALVISAAATLILFIMSWIGMDRVKLFGAISSRMEQWLISRLQKID